LRGQSPRSEAGIDSDGSRRFGPEGLTRPLAEHLAGIALARLPAAVIAKAKDCVLDALGCGVAGSGHPAITTLLASIRPPPVRRGLPGASVWGTRLRASVASTALLNGSMTHAVNFDDAHKESMGHPGTVVVPAALAVGEMVAASGAAVLEAVVAGYEALLRVGMGIGVASHRDRGWYATASLGPFGAAAAAARLLKLRADGIASALGHAGAQASGLWAFAADGSPANIVSAGRAAESGVLGALLARSGLHGPRLVLEAEDGGFLRAMSDRPEPDLLLAGLGERYRILDVSLKPYPCSRTTHAPIDGALKIRARRAGRPGWLDGIRAIRVHTYAVAKRQADIRDPATEWMATLSIPYTVAVALAEGAVGVEHFTRACLDAPRIRSLMAKVEVVVDDAISARFPASWSCRVEIVGPDGGRESEPVEAARGDPRDPMRPDEVARKFHGLTRGILGDRVRDEVVSIVDRLDGAGDVTRLVSLLGSPVALRRAGASAPPRSGSAPVRSRRSPP
jgi:2-methylcitrate dehydratase PrpD